ncbi:MAG: BatD family protein, partial [Verrucomicrobiales bacterium]|nr:BatD family protein [Verrucomicrobiales bacterium]
MPHVSPFFRRLIGHLSLGLILSLLAASPVSAEVRVEASITPTQARPNQLLEYKITVHEGRADRHINLRLPLQVGQNSAVVTGQEIIRSSSGITTSAATYSWGLAGQEPGEFVIAPQEVWVNGERHETNEIRLKVLQGGETPTPEATSDPAMQPLMQLRLEKTQIYLGEVIPIYAELHVPRALILRRIGLIEINKDNFAIQRFPQQNEQSQDVVNGIGYNIYTFRSTLAPMRVGQATVGPASMELLVEEMLNRPRPGSPFGGFPFGEPRKEDVRTQTITVQVLDLPTAGKPANFSGAVGDFTLRTLSNPDPDMQIGSPITLEFTIEGSGNFDAITAPTLTDPTGWKTYPARRFGIAQTGMDPALIAALPQTVTYTTVIVPESHQEQVPPFAFTFFSPSKKQYVTLQSDPIPLQMRETPPAATPTAASTPLPTPLPLPPPP